MDASFKPPYSDEFKRFPTKKSNWYPQSMSSKDAIDSTPDLAHSGVPPQVLLGHSLQHRVNGSENPENSPVDMVNKYPMLYRGE